jgi:hypothetical protein
MSPTTLLDMILVCSSEGERGARPRLFALQLAMCRCVARIRFGLTAGYGGSTERGTGGTLDRTNSAQDNILQWVKNSCDVTPTKKKQKQKKGKSYQSKPVGLLW